MAHSADVESTPPKVVNIVDYAAGVRWSPLGTTAHGICLWSLCDLSEALWNLANLHGFHSICSTNPLINLSCFETRNRCPVAAHTAAKLDSKATQRYDRPRLQRKQQRNKEFEKIIPYHRLLFPRRFRHRTADVCCSQLAVQYCPARLGVVYHLMHRICVMCCCLLLFLSTYVKTLLGESRPRLTGHILYLVSCDSGGQADCLSSLSHHLFYHYKRRHSIIFL